MRKIVLAAVTVSVICAFSQSSPAGENLWYSAFFPGWGQIREGRYGRGALFAGVEVATLTALVVSNIQYDRAVEQYDKARTYYLASTYIGDIEYYYDKMHEKWDDAERLHTYRQVLTGAAVGIWAINLLDMVLFQGDGEPPLTLDVGRGGFVVSKSFSF